MARNRGQPASWPVGSKSQKFKMAVRFNKGSYCRIYPSTSKYFTCYHNTRAITQNIAYPRFIKAWVYNRDKDLDILFRWLQGNRLNVACVQPKFKGGKVSLRIREQYRVRSIFWIAWISVFKRDWLLLRSLILALRLANSFRILSVLPTLKKWRKKARRTMLCVMYARKGSHWGFTYF